MSFTGTLDKCKACDKTVYFSDLLNVDGSTFHKACFKCSHCKGTLQMSSYSSMDGVLYCKPHFEQLFKESGNFSKNFQSGSKPDREMPMTRAPSKLSALFSGTVDKCVACNKTVYPLEKMTMEGESFHKSCFRCAHGGCPLTHSSYAALDGVLYCKHHFQQLFMVKGNYQHVLNSAANKKNAAATAEAEAAAEADAEASTAYVDSPKAYPKALVEAATTTEEEEEAPKAEEEPEEKKREE